MRLVLRGRVRSRRRVRGQVPLKLTPERPCVEALEGFTFLDPVVGAVRITRGESVDADHDAVRAHPRKFGLEGSARPNRARRSRPTQTRQPRTARRTRPEPPSVILDTRSTSPMTFQLSRAARLLIEDRAFSVAGEYEEAGALFGPASMPWNSTA